MIFLPVYQLSVVDYPPIFFFTYCTLVLHSPLTLCTTPLESLLLAMPNPLRLCKMFL